MRSLLQHFFLDGSRDLALALPASCNWMLVAFSVVIASLAAYAALGGAGRIRAAVTSFGRLAWQTFRMATISVNRRCSTGVGAQRQSGQQRQAWCWPYARSILRP